MPKNPDPQTPKTYAELDAAIAAADAERIRLTQVAQSYRNASDSGPNGQAKHAAFVKAWQSQRDLEILQLERASMDMDSWQRRIPPSDAEVEKLSRALDEAKARYHATRSALFRARDSRREHELRGVEHSRNLARIEGELQATERELARREGLLADAERLSPPVAV